MQPRQKRIEALERQYGEMMALKDVIRLQGLVVDALTETLTEFGIDSVPIRQRLSEKFSELALKGLPIVKVNGGTDGTH